VVGVVVSGVVTVVVVPGDVVVVLTVGVLTVVVVPLVVSDKRRTLAQKSHISFYTLLCFKYTAKVFTNYYDLYTAIMLPYRIIKSQGCERNSANGGDTRCHKSYWVA